MTVLLVEDERLVALDLRRVLLRHGYGVVTTAGCSSNALRLGQEFTPQLVIMNVRLRGQVDGVETARQLRERFEFALVYLTGASVSEHRARAASTAPAAWLVKPYTDEQLFAALIAAERSLNCGFADELVNVCSAVADLSS